MSEAGIHVARRLEPEDQARADFYALLGRLYAAPPDASLLRAIAGAPPLAPATLADDPAGAELALAWDRLRAASEAMDPAAARQEFDDLFVGVGLPAVNLHASHWLAGAMMQKPLAELRAELAGLGLARRPESSIVEDHLAALCETMRMLVAGHGDRPPAPVAVQRALFERRIATWVDACCTATEHIDIANYYRSVAIFTKFFMALERDSFAIE